MSTWTCTAIYIAVYCQISHFSCSVENSTQGSSDTKSRSSIASDRRHSWGTDSIQLTQKVLQYLLYEESSLVGKEKQSADGYTQRKNITVGELWEQSTTIGLWNWQIIASCFYLHFTQRLKWTGIGVVHEQYIEDKV